MAVSHRSGVQLITTPPQSLPDRLSVHGVATPPMVQSEAIFNCVIKNFCLDRLVAFSKHVCNSKKKKL